MNIYLIRHTKPAVESKICYGQTDLPVDASFPQELARIKSIIPKKFDVIFTSPLQRCKTLAHNLNADRIIEDNDLMEINFGDWEMKPYTEITFNEFEDWTTDFVYKKAPNGESFFEMNDRVIRAWEKIVSSEYENICLTIHSGVLRCIFAHILGIELKNAFIIGQEYGAVNLISIDKNITEIKFLNK